VSYYADFLAHAVAYCAIFVAGIAVGIRHERHRRIVHRRQRVGRT
jgi:hypothetical protein